MSSYILTLNAGSSSIKFGVFNSSEGSPELVAKGQVEGIATNPHFVAKSAEGNLLSEAYWEPVTGSAGHRLAFRRIWGWLSDAHGTDDILAIGHRIAHGGAAYPEPVVIDEAVVEELTRLIPLVPLHQPHNLAAVNAVTVSHPDLPQVACFDTSFHCNRPTVSDCFALPYELYERGIRRYGFHGLSYEFIAERLRGLAPEVAAGRVVVAHLGSGCSMSAIRDGRSIETTMSFSSLDGVPMGTRCGTLDPGVLLYLMQQEGFDAEALQDLLYKRSGLLGLSGISNDMRALHASEEARARTAIDYFVYRIGQNLGSLCAALGGIDALVFTAGIGENDAALRQRISDDAAWLGVRIDAAANERGDLTISSPDSKVSVWVIPTDEEFMIAKHTLRLVGDSQSLRRSASI
jgi:acetate kinase